MTAKRTLEALAGQIDGQRVVVRADFNIPFADGKVVDDTRLRASVPTLDWLRSQGARVVVLSHFGRPKGKVDPRLSLRPVATVLEGIMGIPIDFIEAPLTDDAVRYTKRMKRGQVALAENTRFFEGEETNAPEIAARFAALGDLFVNDAFGTAHRAHASTVGIAHLLKPAVAGFVMATELAYLGGALSDPARPFVAIVGGAKVSGKIDVLDALLPKVDELLIGGAMACTFFLAQDLEVGTSLVERDKVDLARELLARAGPKIVLPTGAVIAKALRPDVESCQVGVSEIPADAAVFDIDEATVNDFTRRIVKAKTVIWNGPMGVFETPPFNRGTNAIAQALVKATAAGATTIVGGGDSAAALAASGQQHQVTHVSTGGGASLEFLEGRSLPGVEALDNP